MMKKYISMAMVAIAAFTFSGCSNEDIQIDRNTLVSIQPSSVVSPFKKQDNNELQTLADSKFKLRTTLHIYNKEGVLVESATEYLENYLSMMRKNINLPDGTYTMIAITNVVEKTGSNISREIWKIENTSTIGNLKIEYQEVDPNDDFVYQRAILGIGKQIVTIAPQKSEITLRPEPAGSLIRLVYKGIHKFETSDNITQLGMTIDIIPDRLSFDSNGNQISSTRKSSYPVITSGPTPINYRYIDLFKTTSQSAIGTDERVTYFFAFPPTEGTINFRAVYTGKLKSPITCDLVNACEYELMFDLTSASTITDVIPTIEEIKFN